MSDNVKPATSNLFLLLVACNLPPTLKCLKLKPLPFALDRFSWQCGAHVDGQKAMDSCSTKPKSSPKAVYLARRARLLSLVVAKCGLKKWYATLRRLHPTNATLMPEVTDVFKLETRLIFPLYLLA